MAKTKILICPYCGVTLHPAERCRGCGGLFEPLSRQATHNAMGPWFVRDPGRPFQPGCSYETLVKLVERGQVTRLTVLRGPTTRQFWTVARRVPGIAHLLGYCHQCAASVDRDQHACHACAAPFGAYLDRNYLGLPEIRPLPWEARLDDEAPATPGGFGVDGPGRGLSRFASDEELLAGEAAGAFVAEAAVAEPAARRLASAAQGTPGAGGVDDYAGSALTRALQRRVANQQRTIRLLAVVTALLAVVAVATNFGTLLGMFEAIAPGDAGVTPAAAPGPHPAPAGEPVVAPPEFPPHAAGGLPVAPTDAIAQQRDPTSVPAQDDRYDEALRLLVAAEEAQRPLADRIGDARLALEILAELAAGPPEARPAGLGALIDRTRNRLERLVLKDEFYGE